MGWPFGRRSRGRHAAGAPAPRRPAAPLAVAAPSWAAPPPRAEHIEPPAPVAAPVAAPPSYQPPVPSAAVPTGPRVELTFRDGSSAALDADQARALEEIAQVLTRRDGVKQ